MIKNLILALKNKENIFLSGSAGSGKSYTIREVLKQGNFKAAVLASTAIAAANIGGYTVHKFFKFGRANKLEDLRTTQQQLEILNSVLNNLDLIIIDEISMISQDLFEMIYERIKIFPNIALLLVGDFYQLEPVKASGRYAFLSSAWDLLNIKLLDLQEQFRMNNEEFYKHLQNIRVGNADNKSIEYFQQFLEDIDIYSNKFENYTIICAKNDEVSYINNARLSMINSESFFINSKVEYKDGVKLNASEINTWLKELPIEENFEFKIGAKIIFTYNTMDFFNGEQGVIIDYIKDEEIIKIRTHYNTIIYVRPFVFKYFKNPLKAMLDDEFDISEADAIIKAYPMKLSYAITIHKSQGMSIKNLICNCENLFAQGHLYVALSRASDPSTFKIFNFKNEIEFKNKFRRYIKKNPLVENFYKSIKKFDI